MNVEYNCKECKSYSACVEKFGKTNVDDGYGCELYRPIEILNESTDLLKRTYFDIVKNEISKTRSKTKTLGYHTPTKKIGRNQPCPCGSGLKYKRCCQGGEIDEHKTN